MTSSILAFESNREQIIADQWESKTRDVLSETAALKLANLATVRGERGFLLTGDPTFLEPYTEGRTEALQRLDRLEAMTGNNREHRQRVLALRLLVELNLESIERAIAMRQNGASQFDIERQREGYGRAMIDDIMAQIDVVEEAERALLAQRTARAEAASTRESVFVRILGIVGVMLLLLGGLFALALRRSLSREALAMEKLRRIAQTDELTGLANRREILNGLDRMIASSRRHGRPLSLAILDIDHFKRVNDTYGHPVGDEVIKAVGHALTQIMRDQDLVGRLGGEEFVVAFPDCDAGSAVTACERLRQAIGGLDIVIEGGPVLKITLSSGVAEFRTEDDRTTLIARADEALYYAKEGGRDQVRLADSATITCRRFAGDPAIHMRFEHVEGH